MSHSQKTRTAPTSIARFPSAFALLLVVLAGVSFAIACGPETTGDGDDGQRARGIPDSVPLEIAVDMGSTPESMLRDRARSMMTERAAQALSGFRYSTGAGGWSIQSRTSATVQGVSLGRAREVQVGDTRLVVYSSEVSTATLTAEEKNEMATARVYSGTVSIDSAGAVAEVAVDLPQEVRSEHVYIDKVDGSVVAGGNAPESADAAEAKTAAFASLEAYVGDLCELAVRHAIGKQDDPTVGRPMFDYLLTPEEIDAVAEVAADVWSIVEEVATAAEPVTAGGYHFALATCPLAGVIDAFAAVAPDIVLELESAADTPDDLDYFRDCMQRAYDFFAPPRNEPTEQVTRYTLALLAFDQARHAALREALEKHYDVGPGEIPDGASGTAWLMRFAIDEVASDAEPPSVTVGYTLRLAPEVGRRPAIGD